MSVTFGIVNHMHTIVLSEIKYAMFFVCVSFTVYYASGTSIAKFPSSGHVITEQLKNQAHEVIKGETRLAKDVAVLGLYQTESGKGAGESVPLKHGGRIAVYGDSNCLDNSHLQKGKSRVPSPCNTWGEKMCYIRGFQHSVAHSFISTTSFTTMLTLLRYAPILRTSLFAIILYLGFYSR